jgi:hypothetical protein
VLQGPLLLSGAAFEVGTAAADAPLGPLELKRAWVRKEGGDALWHVAVANPTSSGFGVTVVVRLLGPSGETAASDAISFELGRGAEREVESTVAVATSDAASSAASWRIEAWVRVLPAPDRRTLGGTG